MYNLGKLSTEFSYLEGWPILALSHATVDMNVHKRTCSSITVFTNTCIGSLRNKPLITIPCKYFVFSINYFKSQYCIFKTTTVRAILSGSVKHFLYLIRRFVTVYMVAFVVIWLLFKTKIKV